MILDTLDHCYEYGLKSDRFRQGFYYLECLDPKIKDGKYAIDGDNVFCMIQSYETKPLKDQEFEAHRKYADIQYMLEGEESILWSPAKGLKVTKPYKDDAEMYALTPGATELVLTPGRFCVFLPPHDAHAPCLAHGQPCKVRKAVVKVRMG